MNENFHASSHALPPLLAGEEESLLQRDSAFKFKEMLSCPAS